MSKIQVTLTSSPIGTSPRQRRTLEGLGLRRIHQTVEHEDTPSIRGMIARVEHLVSVEKVETE
jgi:large subunit ribosomal protein L30